MKAAIAALQSLAQETRLAVFRLLVHAGPDGMAAGEIAKSLGVPAATMSFHLAHLARAGLIVAARDGRSILYSADFDGMQGLLAYLTEDCCQGHPELCQITATLPSSKPTKMKKVAGSNQGRRA